MVRFPSNEWIRTFKEELNKSKSYEEVAKTWEGDFLFVITPDEELKKEVVFYVDLWHGKCRDAYLADEKKQLLLFSEDLTLIGKRSSIKN